MIWSRLPLFLLLCCPHFNVYEHHEDEWNLIAKLISIFMRTRQHIQTESMWSFFFLLFIVWIQLLWIWFLSSGECIFAIFVSSKMEFSIFVVRNSRQTFDTCVQFGWPQSMHGILMERIMIFQWVFFLSTLLSSTRSKNCDFRFLLFSICCVHGLRAGFSLYYHWNNEWIFG